VAVNATQQGIDPVGSCIGIRGNRIQSIVNELQGEKIDVVSWDNDPKMFISKALSPSEPVHVELSSEDQVAIVVVPDRQLSLAIGKEGQNTRLAARLTGWRLDIKGLTEWEELRERRLRESQQKVAQAAEGLGKETETAEEEIPLAVAEAEQVAIEAEAAILEAESGVTVEAAAELEPAAAEQDEDKILEALILEEEQVTLEGGAPVEEEVSEGFSVEELATFTLDEVEIEVEDSEQVDFELLPTMQVLTPDAGKIRFAEDIVEETRGGGRRDRKGRRGPGNRGARRGGR
jgi:transcription antitermination factor NusA-like protein